MAQPNAEAAFNENELDRLRALRRAAAEIVTSTVMQSGGDIGVSISIRTGAEAKVTRRGHDGERFRSFMIALRRTYAQNDGAHSLTVLNILSKNCPDRRLQLSNLRKSYLGVLASKQVELHGLDQAQVFEAWLYGSVFHDDDPTLRLQWKNLDGSALTSALANLLVESTAIQLAYHVLALDGVIAEVLGEEPLPEIDRVEPKEDGEGQQETAFVEVRVRVHRRSTRRIDFVNTGEGEAKNVVLEAFTPLNQGRETALVGGEAERKFPAPKLRPGESVSLLAALTMGTPTEYEVIVSWDDPSGDRRREDFRIDLLAV